MTFNEFKAWLDGFSEGWGGGNAPSPEQWAKIREKLDSVVPPSLAPLSPYLNPPPQPGGMGISAGRTWRTTDPDIVLTNH